MNENHWFFREFEEGVIHFRDRLQFELKSEFAIPFGKNSVRYSQEFFFTIPESLKIQSSGYDKDQFYQDATTIIRYKTPSLSLRQLADLSNPLSPLSALLSMESHLPLSEIQYPIQMASNIFRSQVREQIKKQLEDIAPFSGSQISDEVKQEIFSLIGDVLYFRGEFERAMTPLLARNNPSIDQLYRYAKEFQDAIVENFFTSFLDTLRKKNLGNIQDVDEAISSLVIEAAKAPSYEKEEEILLRFGKLNKWIYEALSLTVNRVEVQKKHNLLLGIATASIAMLVYLVLFALNASSFAITSFWFILIGTFIYVLKEQVKEGLRGFYRERAYLYFPDFTTDIFAPTGENIGQLQETFTYLNIEDMKLELTRRGSKSIRDEPFMRLSDSVIKYKRELILQKGRSDLFQNEITILFRFNIHRFLEKANDETQTRLKLSSESKKIQETRLPKVYPIHVILKSEFEGTVEAKEFLIVINKKGITRVEFLGVF